MQENELKEQARIKKALLHLNDLVKLLQSKDLDYVDKYLSDKGWKFNNTYMDILNKGESLAIKRVEWCFDKDLFDNNLASGWFSLYIYPTYDNAISYFIVDESHINTLKSEITTAGYKRVSPTIVVERGIESVYRNNIYEVSFSKKVKDYDEKGADIQYGIFIYNFKQVEERQERERQYQSAITRAEEAVALNNFEAAKKAYNEALLLKPENEAILRDDIADVDISILCEEAESLFKGRQYDMAKSKYTEALYISPNHRISAINEKIKYIVDLQQFLQERRDKEFDYHSIETSDYFSISSSILDIIKGVLQESKVNVSSTTLTITSRIDTMGKTTSEYNISDNNVLLINLAKNIINNIQLKPCYKYDYAINAIAEFSYTIENNHAIITVKRKRDGISSDSPDYELFRSEINKTLGNDAPFANYIFDMNKTLINGQQYDKNSLVKVKTYDGGANALLSLLIPGLGDHRVSHGERKGIGIAISTYGLIGAGVGLKLYSNSEYEKYHKATIQSEMDIHYRKANYANLAFYGSIIVAGVIWLSDIIWVAVKGTKNTKHKAYRRSYLGAYYNPNYKEMGLSYSYKF